MTYRPGFALAHLSGRTTVLMSEPAQWLCATRSGHNAKCAYLYDESTKVGERTIAAVPENETSSIAAPCVYIGSVEVDGGLVHFFDVT